MAGATAYSETKTYAVWTSTATLLATGNFQVSARASMQALGAQGVTNQQFNEGAGGQVVFHLHVHVIPRHDGVPMKPPATHKEKPEVLAEHAKKLAAALKG